MPAALPLGTGIADAVMDAIYELMVLKLQTEIHEDDVTRATTIKTGPLQDDPTGVVVLVHENDPDNPSNWPHGQLDYGRLRGTSGSDVEMPRLRRGLQTMGGGSREVYAFSLTIEVWGDEIPMDLAREDVRKIAAIVATRAKMALLNAGPSIGTGNAIQDDFGVTVQMGPYMDSQWAEQEAGEPMIARQRLWFAYVCSMPWSTNGW